MEWTASQEHCFYHAKPLSYTYVLEVLKINTKTLPTLWSHSDQNRDVWDKLSLNCSLCHFALGTHWWEIEGYCHIQNFTWSTTGTVAMKTRTNGATCSRHAIFACDEKRPYLRTLQYKRCAVNLFVEKSRSEILSAAGCERRKACVSDYSFGCQSTFAGLGPKTCSLSKQHQLRGRQFYKPNQDYFSHFQLCLYWPKLRHVNDRFIE